MFVIRIVPRLTTSHHHPFVTPICISGTESHGVLYVVFVLPSFFVFHTAVYTHVCMYKKELRLVRPIIIMWYTAGRLVCVQQAVRESAAHTLTTLLLYVSRLWRGLSVLLLLSSWGVCGSNHDEEEGTIYIYLNQILYTLKRRRCLPSLVASFSWSVLWVCVDVFFAALPRACVCVCVRVGTPPFLLDARKNQPRNAIIRDTHTYAFPYDMTMMMMMR